MVFRSLKWADNMPTQSRVMDYNGFKCERDDNTGKHLY